MKGYFITIEGIDGCGKSTQGRLLTQAFVRAEKRVVHTWEPGGTPLGRQIRAVFLDRKSDMNGLTELFLMAADRADHVAEVIKPAIKSGKTVICERYVDSSVAYQGYGRGVCLNTVREVNEVATGGFMPDFTLLLDLTPQDAFLRRRRTSDRIEAEKNDFFSNIRAGYLKLHEQFPDRIMLIDASHSTNETHRKIINALADRGVLL